MNGAAPEALGATGGVMGGAWAGTCASAMAIVFAMICPLIRCRVHQSAHKIPCPVIQRVAHRNT